MRVLVGLNHDWKLRNIAICSIREQLTWITNLYFMILSLSQNPSVAQNHATEKMTEKSSNILLWLQSQVYKDILKKHLACLWGPLWARTCKFSRPSIRSTLLSLPLKVPEILFLQFKSIYFAYFFLWKIPLYLKENPCSLVPSSNWSQVM